MNSTENFLAHHPIIGFVSTLIGFIAPFIDGIIPVLQFIGANIELPNGQINESSFVLLGATLFYFVNDSQGKKNDSK